MRTLHALLLCVLSVVVVVACGGGGLDVGVSASEPLGSPARIEAQLAAKGLRRSEVQPDDVKQFIGLDLAEREGVKVIEFADSVATYKHAVLLVKDDKGKLLAFVGVFRSGAFIYSDVGTKCEVFTAQMWRTLSGKGAEFTKKNDASLGHREYMDASFTKGSVRGHWRKDSQDENMRNPQGVVDCVVMRIG